jgi:hypothetical protein
LTKMVIAEKLYFFRFILWQCNKMPSTFTLPQPTFTCKSEVDINHDKALFVTAMKSYHLAKD